MSRPERFRCAELPFSAGATLSWKIPFGGRSINRADILPIRRPWFNVDYGNNTVGPLIEPDDFQHLICFYCFDDVKDGMAPIRMVPNGHPDEEAVSMIVPGSSVCLYSIFTRDAASTFTAERGHRPVMWVGLHARIGRGMGGARSDTRPEPHLQL